MQGSQFTGCLFLRSLKRSRALLTMTATCGRSSNFRLQMISQAVKTGYATCKHIPATVADIMWHTRRPSPGCSRGGNNICIQIWITL